MYRVQHENCSFYGLLNKVCFNNIFDMLWFLSKYGQKKREIKVRLPICFFVCLCKALNVTLEHLPCPVTSEFHGHRDIQSVSFMSNCVTIAPLRQDDIFCEYGGVLCDAVVSTPKTAHGTYEAALLSLWRHICFIQNIGA